MSQILNTHNSTVLETNLYLVCTVVVFYCTLSTPYSKAQLHFFPSRIGPCFPLNYVENFHGSGAPPSPWPTHPFRASLKAFGFGPTTIKLLPPGLIWTVCVGLAGHMPQLPLWVYACVCVCEGGREREKEREREHLIHNSIQCWEVVGIQLRNFMIRNWVGLV